MASTSFFEKDMSYDFVNTHCTLRVMDRKLRQLHEDFVTPKCYFGCLCSTKYKPCIILEK
jgi:hypothetical protein